MEPKKEKSFNDVMSYWAVKDTKEKDLNISKSGNKLPNISPLQQQIINKENNNNNKNNNENLPDENQIEQKEIEHQVEQIEKEIKENLEIKEELVGEENIQEEKQSIKPQSPEIKRESLNFYSSTDILEKEREIHEAAETVIETATTPSRTPATNYDIFTYKAQEDEKLVVGSEQPPQNEEEMICSNHSFYRATNSDSSSTGYSGVYSAQQEQQKQQQHRQPQQKQSTQTDSYGSPMYSSDSYKSNVDSSSTGGSSSYNPYGIAHYSGSDNGNGFYSSESGESSTSGGSNYLPGEEEDEEFFVSTNDNIHRVNVLPVEATSGCSWTNSGEENNWNSTFQHFMDLPCSEEKYKNLSNIANDFVYCADSFGKIIISELHLPIDQKTIKPLDLGGVAGGYKYKCQDIIFKFVVDTELIPGLWMYGEHKRSDERAQKSAGHEIKGLNHFMELSTLIRFPLMAIIDYRGYRLLAISSLPINKGTIVYGSCDGGKTVHKSDPAVNEEMERMAKLMNLRGHVVGANKVFIYGPGDIEIHAGLDGRKYMLDFARVFPPEFPKILSTNKRIGREIFYSMVRPELLSKSDLPISSDAFSGWQTDNADIVKELNDDTKRLSERLHYEIIPDCIKIIESSKQNKKGNNNHNNNNNNNSNKDLTSLIGTSSNSAFSSNSTRTVISHSGSGEFSTYSPSVLTSDELEEVSLNFVNVGGKIKKTEKDFSEKSLEVLKMIDFLHSRGVNLRYLGIISKSVSDREIKNLLLTEVVARVWKKIIRSRIREKMDSSKRPSEGPYKHIMSDVFEVILTTNKAKHREFWTETSKGTFKYVAQRVFPKCLSKTDRQSSVDIRSIIDTRFLAYRIIQMMNIRINNTAFGQFLSNPKYVISYKDIEEVGSVVKHPNIIDFSAGSFLFYESQRIINETDHSEGTTPVEINRWIENSQIKLRAAARSMPLSFKVLYRSSMTNILLANISTNFKESIEICKTTLDSIRRTRSKHKGIPVLLALEGIIRLKLGNYYLFCSHSYPDFKREIDQAREKLEEALSVDPNAMNDFIAQSIPLERLTFKTEVRDKALSFSERRRNNELFSMVLMMNDSSEQSILRTILPNYFKRIIQIKDFSIPIALSRILGSNEINLLTSQLPNLHCFNVNNITFTPEIGKNILVMKDLKNLKLEKTFFSNSKSTSTEITSLNHFIKLLLTESKALVSLQLNSRAIDDDVFEGNYHLFSNLLKLTLVDTYITDKTLIGLAPYLGKLVSLSLTASRDYKDEGLISVLESAQKLKSLCVSYNSNITDKSAQVISKYSSELTELYLSRSKISAAMIAEIVSKTPKIRILDLSSSFADVSMVYSLNHHGSKHLEQLYLSNTEKIGDDYLDLLLNLSSTSTLKTIHMAETDASDELVWKLFSKMENIQELKLPAHFHLPSFMEWFDENTNVNSDDMMMINSVSDQPLYNLKTLDLTMAVVSLQSIQQIFQLCPQLENFTFSAVTFVNDQSIVIDWCADELLLFSFFGLFSNLREINLSNSNIEPRNIRTLICKCPSLRIIHLWNCKNISSQQIYDLSVQYPYIHFD
ncbi:hypothetical protein DDB_G0287315 [Dictyostelium discoideum AX4]|uniref:Clu domain-containing protein n=1 Tax=Dictyostelium discoideum TaxID=44689 RepID=Q54KJ2_DICDI|nr:hypothetical protein DDB_G0287315 [Dictyostelium discoideum AX4]EAL63725.1 hypothetical protein DDB_G0287315 [Dictyostelium discoideum AX4]|eukprot:XP_637231.1 hypothetical protein DDB_G0287315 [Dictyostelium discoideum AX4]